MSKTHAAVAAKTSDLFAVVSRPTLIANRIMYRPTITSFTVGFETACRVMIATKSSTTATKTLMIFTNRVILRSGT